MKKLILIAFLLLLLPACVNVFNKKSKESVTDKTAKKYSFNFEIEKAISEQDRDRFVTAINKRLESKGYDKKEVTLVGDNKFTVELESNPGVIYFEQDIIDLINRTPSFAVWMREKSENLVLSDQEKADLVEYNKNAKQRAQDILAKVIADPSSFAQLAKENSEDPGSVANGGLYTGIKKGSFVPEYEDVIFNKIGVGEIYGELVKSQFGWHIIAKNAERGEGDDREIDTSHILIREKTEAEALAAKEWLETKINGLYIKELKGIQKEDGTFAVQIIFDEEGTKYLEELTTGNIGRDIALVIDGAVIGTPKITEVITSGEFLITGQFSEEAVNTAAERFKNGAIHARVRNIDKVEDIVQKEENTQESENTDQPVEASQDEATDKESVDVPVVKDGE